VNVLSVVLPCLNEEENIPNVVSTLEKILSENSIPFELVFVDDGSTDKTWSVLSGLSSEKPYITSLRFSRNFGKESAIFAGLKCARGDAVAVMDCDLQHPPETLVEMYRLWKDEGFEVVDARKASRGREGVFYRMFAKSFYKLMKSSSNLDLDGASDFKLMDKRVSETICAMPERVTFFRALSTWVGFRTATVYFDVAPRAGGQTKWSFKRLFSYAVSSITSFSSIPMQFVTLMGSAFFIFAVIMAVQTLYNLFSGRSVEGFTTVILLLLIVGSVIMFSLGIIGYYLSKIYEEIKFRPRYIISEIKQSDTANESDIPEAKH